jgi:predicted nuclease of predicted toxin-antitoxin system
VKFLADECCPAPVVRRLRTAGHDVVFIAEVGVKASDLEVLDVASRDERILITEDKDFGEHVVRRGMIVPGVILLRLPATRGVDVAERVMQVVEELGEQLLGKYVVVLRARIRLRSLDQPD